MPDTFPSPEMALTHIIVAESVSVSAKWYRDVLGAELRREYGTSAVFSFNGSWLLLVKGGPPTLDKPNVEFAPPNRERASHSFTIRVPDCRAAYETLRSRGAIFLIPPHDWGTEIRCSSQTPTGIYGKSARSSGDPDG